MGPVLRKARFAATCPLFERPAHLRQARVVLFLTSNKNEGFCYSSEVIAKLKIRMNFLCKSANFSSKKRHPSATFVYHCFIKSNLKTILITGISTHEGHRKIITILVCNTRHSFPFLGRRAGAAQHKATAAHHRISVLPCRRVYPEL